jgi:hypothetical protein
VGILPEALTSLSLRLKRPRPASEPSGRRMAIYVNIVITRKLRHGTLATVLIAYFDVLPRSAI